MSGISIVVDSGTQFENGAAQLNSICKLDSNTYVVAFQDNNDGNKAKALIGTRTGTSISVNFANAATLYSNSIDCINVVAMSSTKIAIAFRDSSSLVGYTVICTISGTTITAGTPVAYAPSTVNYCAIVALDASNVVFVVYTGAIAAVVGSVSGTTPSYGSAQSIVATSNAIAPIFLDSTHFAMAYHQSTSGDHIRAIVCSVNTGAQTITAGAESANLSTTAFFGTTTPLIAAFDSQHFIVGWTANVGGGFTNFRYVACEVNLTTLAIAVGSTIDNNANTSTDSNYSLCTIGVSNALIAYYTTVGTQCEMKGITLTGATTIAFDAQGAVVVDNNTSSYTALCALSTTDFIIGLKEG